MNTNTQRHKHIYITHTDIHTKAQRHTPMTGRIFHIQTVIIGIKYTKTIRK